jgi:hypothetical protein
MCLSDSFGKSTSKDLPFSNCYYIIVLPHHSDDNTKVKGKGVPVYAMKAYGTGQGYSTTHS